MSTYPTGTDEDSAHPSPALVAALTRALSQVASSDNPAIVAGLAALTGTPPATENPLLDINAIGAAVFGENAPSVRTLRTLTKRGILPYFRIGKLVRYDARLVRAALEVQCLVRGKKAKATGGA